MRRNVTITLDDETARWARVEAARQDTSVSRFVGALLRERMEAQQEYGEARDRYLARPAAVLSDPRCAYPSRDELHARPGPAE
jgi:hypothetical protein